MQSMGKFRTDLALEAADTSDKKLPEGVFVRENKKDGVLQTIVEIKTPQAAERLQRPPGEYWTWEAPLSLGEALTGQLAQAMADAVPKEGTVLVVGLGNRSITSDALGPDTAQSIIATHHINPGQAKKMGLEDLRSVCTLAPGAMGQTGIETAELISALVRQISFSSIIAVDALAARSMGRLGATVQFSTSGIAPGSGVHNRRAELSERTLGIPVFSLGIPTVVDAVTMMHSVCSTCEPDKTAQALIVTPRDIDRIIAQGSRILATAINRALQPALSADDIDLLMED